MKKTFSFFLLMLIFSFSIKSFGQVNLYTFSSSAGVYTPIVGTLVDSATTTSGATSLDDVNYLSMPIGFTFNYNSLPYTTYSLTTNGFITFGATAPGTTNYTAISSTTAYSSAIAGISRDIQGIFGFNATRTLSSTTLTGVTDFAGIVVGKLLVGTGITTGTRVTGFNIGLGEVYMSIAATAAGTTTLNCCSGELRTETVGAAGSRIHTIQWTNFKRFSATTLTDCINFQIKLYEANGTIEVVYGKCQANSTAIVPQVGLRGATNTDFNNRSTTTDWSATTAGGTNTATCTMSNTVFPANGQLYRWAVPIGYANDVGVTALLAPVGAAGSVNPMASVKNYGTNNQLVPFNVTCTINPGGYSSTVTDTVTAGLTNSVTFANVNLAPGTYNVVVYTSLGSDQDRTNDTLKKTVTLIEANFGSDSGTFFANNLAIGRPSFPKWAWKDTTGSKNLVLNGVSQQTVVGGLDDGYWKKSLKSILLECNQDTTGKHLKYKGVCYDSIFPCTNGIIGFTEAYGTYSLSDFNIDGAQVAQHAILPFWHDANLGNLVNGKNRLSYKVKQNQLIITYDLAVSFAPTTDWVSYQVVIDIAKSCADDDMNWRVTFADTTNGRTSASFVADYLLQYPATPPAVTTFRNYVMGYSNLGAPSVYAGYVSSGNPFPATPVTEINIKRPAFNLTTGAGLAIEFGPNQNILNMHDALILCVGLSLEGLQSNPTVRVRDSVDVYVRDGQIAPYKIFFYQRIYLDSAWHGSYSYGRKYLDVSLLKRGAPIYIVIRHRNSIRSWSNLISSTSDTVNYDFTSSISQTFGSNATVVNGASSFYSGDITQDGVVDGADGAIVDNDASNFTTGDYVISDLNWDGIVDGADGVFTDNNSSNFVSEITPPGASAYDEYPALINYNYKVPVSHEIIPDPKSGPKIDLNTMPLKEDK